MEGNSDENPLIVKVFVAMSDSSSETNLERNVMHPITAKRQQALKDVLDKSRHSKNLRGETHSRISVRDFASNQPIIGTSDFEKVTHNQAFFVDKTMFIEEFIKDGSEVAVILRPRQV